MNWYGYKVLYIVHKRMLKHQRKQMLWCQLLAMQERQSLKSNLSHCKKLDIKLKYACTYIVRVLCTQYST